MLLHYQNQLLCAHIFQHNLSGLHEVQGCSEWNLCGEGVEERGEG